MGQQNPSRADMQRVSRDPYQLVRNEPAGTITSLYTWVNRTPHRLYATGQQEPSPACVRGLTRALTSCMQ